MGKVILITGASQGIGAATAQLAAQEGYAVCVNYRSNRQAAEMVVQLVEEQGIRAIAVKADIAEEKEVIRLFETVDQQLGKLDALVNNAGILEKQSKVENMGVERLQRIFAVNITGSFLCAREAIRRMSTKQGGAGGSIVNVSSGASRTGAPFEYVDYAASKGAIDSMTLGLAREVGPEGIRVNAVRPGLIHTEIHARGGEPERIDRLKNTIPLERGGTSFEVAQAILWLLSSKASFTTGALIDVAGGR